MSKEKFIEAISYATDIHQDQKRKLNNIPYILHPMEVASIISTMTNNDDVMISGILHDVVEDTEGTLDEIRQRFGDRVYELVGSETEDKLADRPPEETWKQRKQESLDVLKNSNDIDIKRLWLADKLSNIRSFWHAYLEKGDVFFEAFHQKDKEEHEWYYRTVLEAVAELKDTAAYKEYEFLLNIVFGKK